MNIVVCVKQVPDTWAERKLKPDNAEPWLKDALAQKRKIMGFGHRVYKNGDSRVPTMLCALRDIAAVRDGQRLLDLYETLAGQCTTLRACIPTWITQPDPPIT